MISPIIILFYLQSAEEEEVEEEQLHSDDSDPWAASAPTSWIWNSFLFRRNQVSSGLLWSAGARFWSSMRFPVLHCVFSFSSGSCSRGTSRLAGVHLYLFMLMFNFLSKKTKTNTILVLNSWKLENFRRTTEQLATLTPAAYYDCYDYYDYYDYDYFDYYDYCDCYD